VLALPRDRLGGREEAMSRIDAYWLVGSLGVLICFWGAVISYRLHLIADLLNEQNDLLSDDPDEEAS
jgi:hypothetical protein